MICSLLATLAAYATPVSDSAFDDFSSTANPATGALGTWSYGYYGTNLAFTLLPNMIQNAPTRLYQWQLSTSLTGGVPRIAKNYSGADRTATSVSYPGADFLVFRPRNTNAAVMRFTATTAATYDFDVNFKSMRTANGASTAVSMTKNGVTVGGCAAPITGLTNGGPGTALVCSNVQVILAAGEFVDFVVDAAGTQAYDDVGLDVHVSIAGSDDSDSDGLIDSDEFDYGTDPDDSDTDDDALLDGEEVHTYFTDPNDSDSDDDGLFDGAEVHTYFTDPNDADTDGGGVDDGVEVALGGNPSDPGDDLPGDDLEVSFDGLNPDQGGFGQWSYGYLDGGVTFTELPTFTVSTATKQEIWQLTSTSGSVPRVVNNYFATDKAWTSVLYPAEEFLVVRPKVGKPVAVRFTADEDGNYRFDTTFRSMRTRLPVSVYAYVQQDGVVVDGCEGGIAGLNTSVSGNELRCQSVTATLDAGESVDFVVDALTKDTYDEIGLSVSVYGSLLP